MGGHHPVRPKAGVPAVASRRCPARRLAASAEAQDASFNIPSPVSAMTTEAGVKKSPWKTPEYNQAKSGYSRNRFWHLSTPQPASAVASNNATATLRPNHVPAISTKRSRDASKGAGGFFGVALELRRDLDEARQRGAGVARGEAEPRRTADAHQSRLNGKRRLESPGAGLAADRHYPCVRHDVGWLVGGHCFVRLQRYLHQCCRAAKLLIGVQGLISGRWTPSDEVRWIVPLQFAIAAVVSKHLNALQTQPRAPARKNRIQQNPLRNLLAHGARSFRTSDTDEGEEACGFVCRVALRRGIRPSRGARRLLVLREHRRVVGLERRELLALALAAPRRAQRQHGQRERGESKASPRDARTSRDAHGGLLLPRGRRLLLPRPPRRRPRAVGGGGGRSRT